MSDWTRRFAILLCLAGTASLAHCAAVWASPESGSSLESRLFEQLPQDRPATAADLAGQMRYAAARIDQSDSGPATQTVQKEIVARLDDLLDQARQQSAAGQQTTFAQQQSDQPTRGDNDSPAPPKPAGGTPKPSDKPAGNPQAEAGTATVEPPDTARMRGLLKEVWGELPPAQRDEILQLPPEEFLPQYQRAIEAYFRQLAEPHEANRWLMLNAPQ